MYGLGFESLSLYNKILFVEFYFLNFSSTACRAGTENAMAFAFENPVCYVSSTPHHLEKTNFTRNFLNFIENSPKKIKIYWCGFLIEPVTIVPTRMARAKPFIFLSRANPVLPKTILLLN